MAASDKKKVNIDKFESVVDYNTKLENFDGPLDLLLYLIKQAQIEIKDIFVSEVTEQFLEYIQSVDRLDIEKASEYLAMAATILDIKARSVLPSLEPEETEEDPKAALIRKIEEYKIFKEKAEQLKEIETVDRFYKEPDESAFDVRIIYKDFTLQGLIKAFAKLMEQVDIRDVNRTTDKSIPKEVFTVRDKIEFIKETLLERESCSFFELFTRYYTKNELITTFQAMLELLKHQYILVEQKAIYDDITITLNPDRSEEIGEIDEYN